MKGGVYAYRTRKPGFLGKLRIPLVSWHWGYVGESSSFYHRHQQHVYGLGKYSTKARDWADLSPYVAFRIPLPNWVWLRRSVETLCILALWPVYNVQKNRWNPRRIPLSVAAWQRRQRDLGRPSLNFPRPGVAAVYILALAVASWYLLGKAA